MRAIEQVLAAKESFVLHTVSLLARFILLIFTLFFWISFVVLLLFGLVSAF